jgi:hypothetical protein
MTTIEDEPDTTKQLRRIARSLINRVDSINRSLILTAEDNLSQEEAECRHVAAVTADELLRIADRLRTIAGGLDVNVGIDVVDRVRTTKRAA